jgi:hypothetical protein
MNRNLTPNLDESQPANDVEPEQRLDRSVDHVSRVRAAREAAQREIDAFGDVSEYEIRKVYGQHGSLDYGGEPAHEVAEDERQSAPIARDRRNNPEDDQEHAADNTQREFDFYAHEHDTDRGPDELPTPEELL